MIRYYGIIREAAAEVARAALETTAALVEGRVEQEPAFTDRMLGRMEHAMDGFETKGVRWAAKTLTDRAPGSQESRFGADFAGVLQIDLPDYQVRKGFLAQAKLLRGGGAIGNAEVTRLREQCKKMLRLTPHSYVFLYSESDIRVVPALAVVSMTQGEPSDLYSRSVSTFYEDHFECFIGDERIAAPNIKSIEGLRRELQLPRLLHLQAAPAWDGVEETDED